MRNYRIPGSFVTDPRAIYSRSERRKRGAAMSASDKQHGSIGLHRCTNNGEKI